MFSGINGEKMSNEVTNLDRNSTAIADRMPDSPTPAEAASPVLTETRPEKEINQKDFGLSRSEVFNPDIFLKDIRGKELKDGPTLRQAFENNLDIVFTQLTQYQALAGSELSPVQKDFIVLYKKKGKELLKTAQGWALANLIIEQDMALRFTALNEQLKIATEQEYTLERDEEKHLTFKNLQSIWGRIGEFKEKDIPRGLKSLRKSLIGKDTGKFDWKRLLLNSTGLSPENQKYIKYLSLETNKDTEKDFLIEAAKAKINFYEALGMDPNDLEAVTPFERYGVIPAGTVTPTAPLIPADWRLAQENINTEWMRVRNQFLEDLATAAPGGTLNNPQQATELYFQAHEKTIRYFMDREVKTFTEIALKIKEGSSIPPSISNLEQRIKKLKAPKGREEERRVKANQLKIAQSRLEHLENEKEEKQREIDINTIEKDAASDPTLPPILTAKENRINATIGRLKTLRDNQNNEMNAVETRFNAAISAATDSEEKTSLQSEKATQKTTITENIRRLESQISENEKGLDLVVEEKNKVSKLTTVINSLTTRMGDINNEIGNIADPTATPPIGVSGLRKKIADLEEDLRSEQPTANKEKIRQIEASITCLKNYDRIVSDPLFNEAETFTSLKDLAGLGNKDEYGTNYLEGYLRTLDHVFKYQGQEERNKAFKTAEKILSSKELAQIINNHLNLGFQATFGRPINSDNDLLMIYHTLAANRQISQARFTSVFIPILKHIENKAQELE